MRDHRAHFEGIRLLSETDTLDGTLSGQA